MSRKHDRVTCDYHIKLVRIENKNLSFEVEKKKWVSRIILIKREHVDKYPNNEALCN